MFAKVLFEDISCHNCEQRLFQWKILVASYQMFYTSRKEVPERGDGHVWDWGERRASNDHSDSGTTFQNHRHHQPPLGDKRETLQAPFYSGSLVAFC